MFDIDSIMQEHALSREEAAEVVRALKAASMDSWQSCC